MLDKNVIETLRKYAHKAAKDLAKYHRKKANRYLKELRRRLYGRDKGNGNY